MRYSSIFWALQGAHAPGRVHSPPKAGRRRTFRKLYDFFACFVVGCFFRELYGFTKDFFVIILEGIWIGKRFPKLVMAISYVQMLVSFEHVVAAVVSELLKEKDTVLSRSLC